MNTSELGKQVRKMEKRWARSFPIRRLDHGEAAFYDLDGKRHWPKEVMFIERDHGMVERLDISVREVVGKKALVFRISPVVELPPQGPVLWMSAMIVDREVASQMGRSFQREINTGPKAWRS